MKKLFLATRLRIFVATFLVLNFLTISAALTSGEFRQWHWIFAVATVLVAGMLLY